MRDYLTTEQAASLLGVTPAALRTRRVRGLGPEWVKVSRNLVLYPVGPFEEWLATYRPATTRATDEPQP